MDQLKFDIAQSFANGNEKAFRSIYEKHAPSLRYFAGKYLTDIDTIDDVIQDAFIYLWEKRSLFSAENAIKAYLYRIVQTSCLNLIRHRKIKEKYAENYFPEEDNTVFFDRILESEIFQTLIAVFEELPPACKEVYKLSLEGMKHDEIAEKLHISINTVKKHKNNANHYMRKRLKNVFNFILFLNGI